MLLMCGRHFEECVCPLSRIAEQAWVTPRAIERSLIQRKLPDVEYYKECHIIPDYLPCEIMPEEFMQVTLYYIAAGTGVDVGEAKRLIPQIRNQIVVGGSPKPTLWILVAELLNVIDKALAKWKSGTKRKGTQKKSHPGRSSRKNEWDKEEGWDAADTEQGHTIHFRRDEAKVVYRGRSTVISPFQSVAVGMLPEN